MLFDLFLHAYICTNTLMYISILHIHVSLLFYTVCSQVLQMSDILEHNGACSDQSVVILLVFLASQLMVKKNMVMLGAYEYFADDI